MQEVVSRSIDFQGGLTGCKVISNTTATVGAFQGFVVNEEAIISQVLDKNGVNVTSTMGLTGTTISQGMLITAAKGTYFSSITLVSGSIIVYFV